MELTPRGRLKQRIELVDRGPVLRLGFIGAFASSLAYSAFPLLGSGAMDLRAPAAHDFVAFLRAVVPAAKPLIERHRAVTAVVALEIPVMQVVKIALTDAVHVLAFRQQFVESDMTQCRREAGLLHVEDRMQRVRQQDPVEQYAAEIKNVFHRVHRHARPGADVGILMVQRVHRLIEETAVQKAVDKIEVGIADHRNGAE